MRIRADSAARAVVVIVGVPYIIYQFYNFYSMPKYVPAKDLAKMEPAKDLAKTESAKDFAKKEPPQQKKIEPQQDFRPWKRLPDTPAIEILAKQIDKVSTKPSVAEGRNIAPVLNQYYILTGSDRTWMETYNKVSLSCLGK
jgi:hypothetical protein